MFERLKRALSGSPPEPAASVAPLEPGRLDWITAETPYRFTTWLVDPSQRDKALEILGRRVASQLTAAAVAEPDGRVRLDLESTREDELSASGLPVAILQREGVAVRGGEMPDLVDDVPPQELERLVAAWEARQYDKTLRRRMAALTGDAILRYALDADRGDERVNGWDFVVSSVGRKTPGSEVLLLERAVAERDVRRSSRPTAAAALRGETARLWEQPFDPPVDHVLELASRPNPVAEQAFRIALILPAPLPDELTTVLCEAVRHPKRGSVGSYAIRALRNARPSDEVRVVLETALESTDADAPGIALATLGAVFGVGARPYWQAWLESSSWPRRMTAEDVMGEFGDADDVPLGAEHLGKIIRRTSSISWEPPRGSEIIKLLVRHRDAPEAQAALADLTKRWPKLPEELQTWLTRNHPDLVPAMAPALVEPAQTPDDVAAEPPLTWPVPEIKRDGDAIYVGFWDTDMFAVSERFEELLDAHPNVTLLDGDREWLTARIDLPDPEALIRELWARAQESSSS
jgi:hypothetical protein